jgi:hypothetical protein
MTVRRVVYEPLAVLRKDPDAVRAMGLASRPRLLPRNPGSQR